MAALTWVWIHRVHGNHRGLGTGGKYVSAEVAAELIRDGCAQDVQTDARRLIHPGGQEPFIPPRAPAVFESEGEEEPPPLEEDKAPPKRPPKRSRGRPRKGTYKTTRLTPDA